MRAATASGYAARDSTTPIGITAVDQDEDLAIWIAPEEEEDETEETAKRVVPTVRYADVAGPSGGGRDGGATSANCR